MVVDEVGGTMRYTDADGQGGFAPDVRSSFSNASLKGELTRTATGFTLKKSFGTTLYFEYAQTVTHNVGVDCAQEWTETYYRLDKVVDRNGNTLQYEYNARGRHTGHGHPTTRPRRRVGWISLTRPSRGGSGPTHRVQSVTDALGSRARIRLRAGGGNSSKSPSPRWRTPPRGMASPTVSFGYVYRSIAAAGGER